MTSEQDFKPGEEVMDFIGGKKATIVERSKHEPHRWIVKTPTGFQYSAHEVDLGKT